MIDRAGRVRRLIHGPHLQCEIVQMQERAAVFAVRVNAFTFEAELLVVRDGAFEIIGGNTDVTDSGDVFANAHMQASIA